MRVVSDRVFEDGDVMSVWTEGQATLCRLFFACGYIESQDPGMRSPLHRVYMM